MEDSPLDKDIFKEDTPAREVFQFEVNTRTLGCDSDLAGVDQVHLSCEFVQFRSRIWIENGRGNVQRVASACDDASFDGFGSGLCGNANQQIEQYADPMVAGNIAEPNQLSVVLGGRLSMSLRIRGEPDSRPTSRVSKLRGGKPPGAH